MDKHFIEVRRGEIEREASLLTERLAALKAETSDLDITERTIDRLTGAKRDSFGAPNKQEAAVSAVAAAAAKPTVRQMIVESLLDARQRGVASLSPKDMRNYIRQAYNLEIGPQVNTNASRMLHELKELEKDENGLFRLASKEIPSGSNSLDGTPEGGAETPNAYDCEAGRGVLF
jgi:hypothetical protein